MNKIRRVSLYLWVLFLASAEQIIKLFVVHGLKGKSITIIKGILKFTYCENKGVAFSFGNGHVPVFIILNILLIGGLVYYYEKNRQEINNVGKMFFILVIAGGLSNLIDRITRGFVVDFIDVNELLNFAIFNVADIFIVVGIFGTIIYSFIREIRKWFLNHIIKIIKLNLRIVLQFN